ncbi:SRPBCC family protein [Kutzneria buriramensis]|uniref:Polyketide cyclase/dehydrase/lipid transport protein n=1 Tax=Kutzneria buriramensis TaxID=1045776 RepID=A0A3E0GXI4_9PSEU|nr:SRPBCC family protein [Kutzneria buriramensis]REH29648.1 polyketide cyclase/dehydrase/lipid transport protein [Kutzneria buriramensis]
MGQSVIDSTPLFDLRAEIPVSATAAEVYAVVSDLTRSAEWSPECMGGTWTSGEPAAVGSVFRGENHRRDDVVGWAPLVRGTWFTEAEIVAAEPGRTFRWAMRTHTGVNQESVWGFDIDAADEGSVLTHHFRMGRATLGIHKITAELDEAARERFVVEWTDKLEQDIAQTLKRIKDVIEQG